MKIFLFPMQSAIPESNGENKATHKKAAEVTKLIKAELNDNDYRKAAVAAKLYNKLNSSEDFTLNYFIGMCEILSNNLSQGLKNMEEASDLLDELLKNGQFKVDKKIKSIVIDGFLKYG